MLADPWQFGLVAVLVATNVAVSYWLYRRLQTPAAGSPLGADRGPVAAESPSVEPTDGRTESTATHPEPAGAVACPACGTPNDPDYRFCRACVAELAASGVAGGGAGDRAGGLPR
jgi:hypothetical protein